MTTDSTQRSAIVATRKPALGNAAFAAALGALAAMPAVAQQAGPAKVMPKVTVHGASDQEDKSYKVDISNIGKLDQEIRDIPQSLVSVPAQLIKERNAFTLREALRNVSSLTFNAGEGGNSGDLLTLRGFSASTDIYIDGIRDNAQYNRDTFNVEQIDVLRGPSSMLFGRGSTGGVINQVNKKASLNRDFYDFSATLGIDDYYRATADLNQRLGETVAARLNVMGSHGGTTRDVAVQRRWGVAPTLTWQPAQGTTITVDYMHMHENNIPDYGVPYDSFTRRPLDVDGDNFYGLGDADYERTTTDIASLKIEQELDDQVKLRNQSRYARYYRNLWPSAPRLSGVPSTRAATGTDDIRRGRPGRDGVNHYFDNQTDLLATFDTGGLRHMLVAGAEISRETSQTLRWNGGAVPNTTVDHPNAYPPLSAAALGRTFTTDVHFTADILGLYAQDLINLTDQVKLLLGLRWDRFDGDYQTYSLSGATAGTVTNTARVDKIWSYRTGLIWQPDDVQSYYAAFGTSFNPSGEAYALDPRGSNTPPEKNRNFEIGAKYDFLGGRLGVRAAIFRTEKTNERNTDPLITDVFLLSGKRRTDGVELEIVGRPTGQWEIFSSFSVMDAEITRGVGNNAADVGHRPQNTPNYTYSLWSTYDFETGWKLGGGFNGVGKRYSSNANTNYMPAYIRFDGMASYEFDRYTVQVNVFNLLDKRYYEGLYTGHTVPGTGRTAQVTLSAHF